MDNKWGGNLVAPTNTNQVVVNPNGIGGTVSCTISAGGKTKTATYTLVYRVEDPNNPIALQGTGTVCPSGSYTIYPNYLPPNVTSVWSVSSNLQISSQNNSLVVVTAPSHSFSNGTISLTFTPYGTSTPITRTKTVWVGKPATPVTSPTGYPIYVMRYGSRFVPRITSAPGSSPSTGVWSSTGSIVPFNYTTGSSCIFEAIDYGRGDVYVSTSNICGSSSWNIPVNVKTIGGGGLFSVYPNPVTDVVNVELLTTNSLATESEISAIDQSTVEEENFTIELWHEKKGKLKSAKCKKRSGSLDLSNLPKGIYFLHVITSTNTYKEQIIKE